jgi:hypothetical protein
VEIRFQCLTQFFGTPGIHGAAFHVVFVQKPEHGCPVKAADEDDIVVFQVHTLLLRHLGSELFQICAARDHHLSLSSLV